MLHKILAHIYLNKYPNSVDVNVLFYDLVREAHSNVHEVVTNLIWLGTDVQSLQYHKELLSDLRDILRSEVHMYALRKQTLEHIKLLTMQELL